MTIRPKSRPRRGVSLVESSVGLTILLFVIFGIMEFGQLIMAVQLMNNAARTAARVAAAGRQPATYPDGTASPSPGGVVDTPYLNTWITKCLAPSPISSVSITLCGSNPGPPPSPNTSIAWNSTQFGRGFYITLNATYVPLFSGNRLVADSSGYKGAMVGSLPLKSVVYTLAEANN